MLLILGGFPAGLVKRPLADAAECEAVEIEYRLAADFPPRVGTLDTPPTGC